MPTRTRKPTAKTSAARVRGEAPPAWPVEGVLNPINCVLNPTAKRASARVRGEAPPAWPVEGVLNPINCASTLPG
jgi:hypothetical protein